MSFLKKLFGGGPADNMSAAEPRVAAEDSHEGFEIAATPIPEGGQYRLAATITKEIGGETKTHKLVRADLFQTEEEATQFAIRKARQLIDEQGERIFG